MSYWLIIAGSVHSTIFLGGGSETIFKYINISLNSLSVLRREANWAFVITEGGFEKNMEFLIIFFPAHY